MLNPTVTNNYFKALSDTLDSLHLKDKPLKIWNIDETSVPLLHKPVTIIAGTASKMSLGA